MKVAFTVFSTIHTAILLFLRPSGFGSLTLPQKDVKAPNKTKKDHFDQRMACKAPVTWSKYTTVLKNLEFCTLSDSYLNPTRQSSKNEKKNILPKY